MIACSQEEIHLQADGNRWKVESDGVDRRKDADVNDEAHPNLPVKDTIPNKAPLEVV